MIDLVKRLLADERVRFLLVGGFNTALGYVLFAGLYLLGGEVIGHLGSLYMSYAIAISLAFMLHRRVTFRAHGTGSLVVDFLRFVSVYVVVLVVNTVGLLLLVDLWHWPPLAAQAVIVVVTTLTSYAGHKWFSFRRPAANPTGESAAGIDSPVGP